MTPATHITSLASVSVGDDRPTTNGTIAVLNLSAQIEGLEPDACPERATLDDRVSLIDLLMLRGQILGRIADYERADEIAEQLVREEAVQAAAFVARARTRGLFHRFKDALDDLDVADRLLFDAGKTASERAAIFQALGRYDEACAIREGAVARQANFENMAALAGLYADNGEIEAALRLHAESRNWYSGVSPFPLALLDFQLGQMWMHHAQWNEARKSFETALRRIPSYVPAMGHLAEVEAELGEINTAVARLYPLAISSDDPDYAAQLARILWSAGRTGESNHWRELAAARYEDLVTVHAEAFVDHAAEFWLSVGIDPKKALRLAKKNFEVRKTPRAYSLLSRAFDANEATGAKSSPTSTKTCNGLRRGREVTLN